jgi:hypothetical protein
MAVDTYGIKTTPGQFNAPLAQGSGGASNGFNLNANAFSAGTMALSGVFSSIGSAYAQQAQGYLQQAGYAAQAQSNLRLSGLRADKEIEYAELAFARRKFQTNIEQLNYKVQANSLLNNLRRTNASARARSAAAGLNPGGGSALAIQEQNVRQTYQDVGMVDLSALVARVFGMEDATNILRSGYDNAFYTREQAISNTNALLTAGGYAADTGNLLAGATLSQGALSFARTVPTKGYFT